MGGRLRRGGMKALAALQRRRWFRRLAAWARRHVAVREARQDELAQVQHLAGGLATAPSLPGQRLTTFVAVREPSLGGGGRREARPRPRRLLGCSQLLCNPDTEGILYPGVWLAFVLVEPKARGAGLGMRLASPSSRRRRPRVPRVFFSLLTRTTAGLWSSMRSSASRVSTSPRCVRPWHDWKPNAASGAS